MVKIDRREFLRRAAGVGLGAAAGLGGLPRLAAAAAGGRPQDRRGRAVRCVRPDLFPEPTAAPSERVYGEMLDAACRRLFGAADATEAFRGLFAPGENVAIKVNTIAGPRLSTRPELVRAIVARLVAAGVPAGNVAVFDRYAYELARAGFAAGRCAGATLRGTDEIEGGGYEEEIVSSGRVGTNLSRMLTSCDALINVPIMKDHELSGVSGALKNHYGSISNPNKYHADGCNPFVADVNAIPAIRDRQRLVVLDGGVAQCEGGPGFKARWAWNHAGILVGTDPVAVDTAAERIIAARRASKGLPTLAEADRPARILATAAARGLGARCREIEDV